MSEFSEKIKTIGLLRGGQTKARVKEFRDSEGQRLKATTDELGNTVTEHADGRQDVRIAAPHVKVTIQSGEVQHSDGTVGGSEG